MRTRIALGLTAISVGVLGLAVLPASASVDKSKTISSSALKALENNINKGKHLRYEATYKSVSNGQTTVVTIAQDPPKSDFSTSSGQVIDTGKSTYYCSDQGGKSQCLSTSTGTNPFVDLEDLFSPGAALAAFGEAKEGLVEKALGIKVSSASAKYAGQSSTCVTVKEKSNSGKYCVTKQGLLAYSSASSSSGSSGGYFEMTKYSSSPSSSLFALPAGATTVTLPGGVSIP
jgi:hypothetical protein